MTRKEFREGLHHLSVYWRARAGETARRSLPVRVLLRHFTWHGISFKSSSLSTSFDVFLPAALSILRLPSSFLFFSSSWEIFVCFFDECAFPAWRRFYVSVFTEQSVCPDPIERWDCGASVLFVVLLQRERTGNNGEAVLKRMAYSLFVSRWLLCYWLA
jgi:hypothetical protein